MTLNAFPIATRVAQRDAFDTTYANPSALLASSEAARGAGSIWRARGPEGVFHYLEVDPAVEIPHLVTAGQVGLRVLPSHGCYGVDAFGALGDGVSDDTDAIRQALQALPDGGTLAFSSGRTYIVSDRIDVRGKSVIVRAYGATIKCRDDSVWHVFRLGGLDAAEMVDHVKWYGGTFDGNRDNQRYYPSVHTFPDNKSLPGGGPDPLAGHTVCFTDKGVFATNDGGESYYTWTDKFDALVLTDRVLTLHPGTDIGTPFYENSPLNGADWDEDGWRGPNGGGNEALISARFAKHVIFEDIECVDYVRNGLNSWNCVDTYFHRCRSTGQLPTTYFELLSLYNLGHEASFLKATRTSFNEIVAGPYLHNVWVSDCYHEGGVMPLFVRTNDPKLPVTGAVVNVVNCQFYGIARELWFELAQSVSITNCDVTCCDFPGSTYRRDPAIFIGSGTQEFVIDKCYVFGRINTNNMQAVRRGVFSNSTLIDYANQEQRSLQCTDIVDSYIESRSGGVLADRIRGSRIFIDSRTNAESFKVRNSLTDTEVGRERFERGDAVVADPRERVTVPVGESSASLSGVPDVVVRVLARSQDFQGGRWYELDASDYTVEGATITIENSTHIFTSKGAETDLEVEWYTNHTETFTTTSALETIYMLGRPGGQRTEDILSVIYDGNPVAHGYSVDDPDTIPHWTHAMDASGVMAMRLVNLPIRDGATLTVSYRPPLLPYEGPELTVHDSQVHISAQNITGIICDGGRNRISGTIRDTAAPAAIRFKDGTERIELVDLEVTRMAGGLLCGIAANARVDELLIHRSQISDWLLQGEKLLSDGDISRARALGCIRPQGTQVLRLVGVYDCLLARTGKEGGAGTEFGRNHSAPLQNGQALQGTTYAIGDVVPPQISTGLRSIMVEAR